MSTALKKSLDQNSQIQAHWSLASLTQELRELWPLALPLALTQLGAKLLGVTDAAILGRSSELELGASALGHGVYFGIAVFGFGVMRGFDPLITQAIGAGEDQRASGLQRQALILAFLLSWPLMALTFALVYSLPALGVSPDIAHQTARYVLGCGPGLLPMLVLIGARVSLEARSRTRPLVIGVIAANLINLPLTWLLVFGDASLISLGLPKIGLPPLGTLGAGLASTVASTVQMAIALAALRYQDTPSPSPEMLGINKKAILKAIALGLPMGLTFLAEVGAFAGTSFFMSRFGERALAAHQIAITLASLTFMIPLGLSAAGTVRVGRAVGRGDTQAARRSGIIVIALAMLTMSLTATLFYLFPSFFCALFTNKEEAIQAAIPLVLIAAVFQLSDGVQVAALGALRGAGDTNFALYANLAGYYLAGVPLGLILAFSYNLQGPGLWWGLCLGLTLTAIALALRFLAISAKPISRADHS